MLFAMTMRCKACSDPRVKEINAAIVSNQPIRAIAIQFGIGRGPLTNHANKHVKSLIKKAQAEIEKAVVKKALSFREEINYPVIDKIKLLQDRIVADLEATAQADRVPLYRELRGALQEEAKLCGLYQENRENDAKVKKALDDIKAYLKEQDAVDREAVITAFATGRNIPRETLARELGAIG